MGWSLGLGPSFDLSFSDAKAMVVFILKGKQLFDPQKTMIPPKNGGKVGASGPWPPLLGDLATGNGIRSWRVRHI